MAPRNPQHRGNPTRAERLSVRVERVDNAGTLLAAHGEPLARQTTWRVLVVDGVEVADVNTRAEARAVARREREVAS